jgi:nucleoside-diphosphate-sugar epimerase
MRIALTGASGFVGRHVLRELLKKDVSIVIVTREYARLEEFADIAQIVELDLINADMHTFDCLGRPDVLLHLAWDGLPNYCSLHHFSDELPKQFNFLNHMITQGLKNLVVTGTCFEYGMQFGSLAEDIKTQPNNPYGFAKDALRQQLQYLKQQVSFNFTWARLFYMYGEGQPETSLLPQLKKAIALGLPQFNMSGGEQLRDFLPIEEVTRYLVNLTMKQQDIGLINVCSGKPQSVRGLVEKWLVENNWDIKLNFGHYPYPDYEPMAFWGERHKLDALLDG